MTEPRQTSATSTPSRHARRAVDRSSATQAGAPDTRAPTAYGAGTAPAQRLDALVGRAIPRLRLERYDGTLVELALLAELGVVVYVYPAAASSPDAPGDSAAEDIAQHRVFDERGGDLRGCSLRVVGVSSEPRRAQLMRVVENRVCHQLICDRELQLARALGLPTFTGPDGAQCYRRLTMIAVAGRVTKVFYPVHSAQRSADQVLSWLRASGR